MFRSGDKIIVDNPKLKTHGLSGVILGEHQNHYWWGSIFNGAYDVLIDGRINTFIMGWNMKRQEVK